MRALGGRNLLGCSADHELAPLVTGLRTDIDNPVGGLDHVEVMLDDNDAVPFGDQTLEGLQQNGDVVDMQTGRRLVEDEEGSSRFVTRKPCG